MKTHEDLKKVLPKVRQEVADHHGVGRITFNHRSPTTTESGLVVQHIYGSEHSVYGPRVVNGEPCYDMNGFIRTDEYATICSLGGGVGRWVVRMSRGYGKKDGNFFTDEHGNEYGGFDEAVKDADRRILNGDWSDERTPTGRVRKVK